LDSEIAIRADSLTKIYRSGGGSTVTVFNDLSLMVEAGERLAVVGESGAGKSTLMHLLGGLDKPTSGEVWYRAGGQDIEINALNEQDLADFRNKRVGFVWQNPSLLLEFSAMENVMMPLVVSGAEPKSAQQKALALLDETGVIGRSGHRAGELSGGEQQRVALARALVNSPAVLLADEPTGSLDFRTAEAMFNLIGDLQKQHKLTSVFVTHNLQFAFRCDRVLELKKGSLHPLSKSDLSDMEWQAAGVVPDATRLNGGTYV
jgi:lipoprotein-releasing system ATP-binding protein